MTSAGNFDNDSKPEMDDDFDNPIDINNFAWLMWHISEAVDTYDSDVGSKTTLLPLVVNQMILRSKLKLLKTTLTMTAMSKPEMDDDFDDPQ